jgi:transcriptional regulator with XRE-family HTH domain
METIDKDWLIEKMKANNLTQRQLAKNLDILENQVSRWVRGRLELGKQTKNHLYWFFRCLELEKEIKK